MQGITGSWQADQVDWPGIIAHADWGAEPRKRQVALARHVGGPNYEVGLLAPADPESVRDGDLRGAVHASDGSPGQLLVGLDCPIGLPRAYASQAGIVSFPDFLATIDSPPWDDFTEIATTPAEISLHRPFYPARSSGAKRSDLSGALELSFDEMIRRCDGGDAEALFWTLGGKQVGKTALSGWECLRKAPPGSNRIWPFEGSLSSLLDGDDATIVVVETNPSEFYRHIEVASTTGTRWSKRRQEDRRLWIPNLLDWASTLGVRWSDELLQRVEEGFSPRPNGENEFDAVVGLLGVIAVVTGSMVSGEPRDDPDVQAVEGWMLGRQSATRAPASSSPAPEAGTTQSLARADRKDVRLYLEVSTLNLPERISGNLRKCRGVLSWPHDLGSYVYVPGDPTELQDMIGEGAPAEVMHVIRYAMDLGCSLIDLRQDLDPNPDLPVYDKDHEVDQPDSSAASEPPAPRPPTAQPMTGPPPGWYADPGRQARVRWWDGYQWTHHISN